MSCTPPAASAPKGTGDSATVGSPTSDIIPGPPANSPSYPAKDASLPTLTDLTITPSRSTIDAGLPILTDHTENGISPLRKDDSPPKIPQEHPLGAEIRRQVEYYFSDENLAHDKHLRQLCGGYRNFPVSLGEILSWRRMRKYKPRTLVIQSLKKSEVLEIIDDKRIRRRTPYVGPKSGANAAGNAAQDGGADLAVPAGYVMMDGVIRKMSKLPVAKATLQPFYAETPIPPAEKEEEKSLYGPDKSITERMETAIQRYLIGRRKLDYNTRRFLDAFFWFGGVETRPRQFAHTDHKALKQLTPAEKAKALAIHHISREKDDPAKWKIDFLGVVQSFLSCHFPLMTDNDETDIEVACKVIGNFYNYLLYHDVCYEDNVRIDQMAARDFVTLKAPKELLAIRKIEEAGFGNFNLACAYLFHGQTTVNSSVVENQLSGEDGARLLVQTAINAMGNDKMFQLVSGKGSDRSFWNKKVRVVREIATGLEIVSIVPPTEGTKAIYAASDSDKVTLELLGTLVCKRWSIPDFAEDDLPKHIESASRPIDDTILELFEFWVEQSSLEHLIIGMKLETTICQLDFGGLGKLWVIAENPRVFASFFRYTLNELHPRPFKQYAWLDSSALDDDGNVEDQEDTMGTYSDGWREASIVEPRDMD